MSAFLVCNPAYAQLTNPDLPDREGVKILNNSRFHGAFKTTENIETNIFYANTDRKIDSITVLTPSAGIDIPIHNGNISADYQAEIFEYGVWHVENHTDQRLRGLAEMEFGEFKVTLNDIMRIFTLRALNEVSARVRQQTNDARVGVARTFNRLMIDAGYQNKLETYQSDDPTIGNVTYRDRERDVHIVDTTVSYRFWPKTSALLENDFGYIHYYNSSQVPDSFYDEVLVGFKGEWFSKANVNYRAGLKWQNYDSSDVINDKGYVGAVMRGGFDYSPTDRDTLVFEFDRELYESTYANMNYYVANLFGFNWQHNFTPKVYSNFSASYQLHQYPSESTDNNETRKRQDNYFQFGAGLKYDVRKWMSLEVKYSYVNRASNFDIYDYVDNVVSFSGTIGF
jgi:hypothetical protein